MDKFSDEWPIEAQHEVQRLRAECARHRIERNKARQELENLQAEIRLKDFRPKGLLTPMQTLEAIRRELDK